MEPLIRKFKDYLHELSPLAILDAVVIAAVLAGILWQLHPNLIFSRTLLTGGDTGSHLVWAQYLHAQSNPFNFTPWYPGWYDGMPLFSFYFILPDLFASLLTYVIGFAVAFKLATIIGSLLLPITAYSLGKMFRAPRPIPLGLAVATLPFLFDASFTIDGGNLFSTMAGEYAFSLGLALALLTIGLFLRAMRRGRGYWQCAIALSLTLSSHVLPWFFAVAAIIVLTLMELVSRRRKSFTPTDDLVEGDYGRPLRVVIVGGLLSAALSAWWLFPFATQQGYTNSMGYTNDDVSTLHAAFKFLGWYTSSGAPAGDRWVIIMAVIAMVLAAWKRDRLGVWLSIMAVLSLGAFLYMPQGVLWNERFVPFWFLSIYLLAGWLVAYLGNLWVEHRSTHELRLEEKMREDDDTSALEEFESEREDSRYLKLMRATLVVGLLGLGSTLPSFSPPVQKALGLNVQGNQVTNWAAWNYSGYEAKSGWPEFHQIMTIMQRMGKKYGCGNAMWEYNSNQDRFGTPEALMLLPYFTNNCVGSMEGLYFESSATTPYHFIDQAELSASPSNPQVGLNYGGVDVNLGIQHLQLLGVKFYFAYTPAIVAAANENPNLTPIAQSKAWPSPGFQWRFYLINNSPVVTGLKHLPNVLKNASSRVNWLNANQAWWLNPTLWNVYGAASGPANWPVSTSINSMTAGATLPKVRITRVVQQSQSISFHVDKIGVPVLVKISYFPNWQARGATGPYRVSPNLMVVVPTSHEVTLVYGKTFWKAFGDSVTEITVGAGMIFWFTRWRRRRA
jgi:hypothetical protein